MAPAAQQDDEFLLRRHAVLLQREKQSLNLKLFINFAFNLTKSIY